MKSTIIAIDLAKDIFEIAIANNHYRILSRKRLNRRQFESWIESLQTPSIIIMEACGTAHHWGRYFQNRDHQVALLPVHYVSPYRRRNKSDRIDCEAMLEAHRCSGIHPVPVKTQAQQELQLMHRLREQCKQTRVQRINFIRAVFREQGIPLSKGPHQAIKEANEALDQLSDNSLQLLLPVFDELATLMKTLLKMEQTIDRITYQQQDRVVLQSIPGVGLLTSTAFIASIGKPEHFSSGRQMACWLGITPREYSSGHKRFLSGISKKGDVYLRTLLIHGARSALNAAKTVKRSGKPLTRLQLWAIQLEQRIGHNKATVALANKIARIMWACWKQNKPYQADYMTT